MTRIKILLLAIPPLLLVPLAWFCYSQLERSAALVQLIAEASKAGLLDNPEVKQLAVTSVSGQSAFTTLFVCITLVAATSFVFGVLAGKAKRRVA